MLGKTNSSLRSSFVADNGKSLQLPQGGKKGIKCVAPLEQSQVEHVNLCRAREIRGLKWPRPSSAKEESVVPNLNYY
jgi:hypothetical protein